LNHAFHFEEEADNGKAAVIEEEDAIDEFAS
jgi:hypothetical protein